MERPKVRFTQLIESCPKNKPESAIQSSIKEKPRVKSIVSTNFPIKILKKGTHLLVKDENQLNCYQDKHFKSIPIYNKEETLRFNNTEYDRSVGISNQCSNFFASTDLLTEMPTDDKSIINQISSSKTHKTIYDQNEIQECVNKLQTNAVEQKNGMNSQRQTFKRDNIQNKFMNDPTSSGILYVNHDTSNTNNNNNNKNSDFELIQTVSTKMESKESKKRDKKKITTIGCEKISTELADTNGINNFLKTVPLKENKGHDLMNKKWNVFNDEPSRSNNTKAFELKNSHDYLPNNILSTKLEEVQEKFQMIPCTKLGSGFPQQEDISEKIPHNRTKKRFLNEIKRNYSTHSEQKEILHKKYNNSHINSATLEHIREKRSLVSNDELNYPKLNSTLKTMGKLKKLEKTKSITNLGHLSKSSKYIINGKVSAALDFSPYESIFSNLIDISRSENELSSCLMQSEDPRPRDKDVVPRLSNFYNPKLLDQEFIYVNPLILNPVNVDILSASTISEKICLWKIFLEKC